MNQPSIQDIYKNYFNRQFVDIESPKGKTPKNSFSNVARKEAFLEAIEDREFSLGYSVEPDPEPPKPEAPVDFPSFSDISLS